jgi:hypothetical protein
MYAQYEDYNVSFDAKGEISSLRYTEFSIFTVLFSDLMMARVFRRN